MIKTVITKHGNNKPTVNDLKEFQLGYSTSDRKLWIHDPVNNGIFGVGGGGSLVRVNCASTADEATKVVSSTDISSLDDGVCLAIKFTNGNTAASPVLKVNNFDSYPIKIANQNIGNGAIVAGDSHLLVFNATNQCFDDLTGDVVYRTPDEVKFRSGVTFTWNGTDLNIQF